MEFKKISHQVIGAMCAMNGAFGEQLKSLVTDAANQSKAWSELAALVQEPKFTELYNNITNSSLAQGGSNYEYVMRRISEEKRKAWMGNSEL